MSDDTARSVELAVNEALNDIPAGRIGGVIAQLRQRAQRARTNSYVVLFALLIVVFAGLAYFLGGSLQN
ncbi:MAG: hypothetical protein AAFR27_03215, partial [Pseudomonadota bacterium]